MLNNFSPKNRKTRNRFKFWRKTKSSVAGERWRIYVCAIGGCKEAGIALWDQFGLDSDAISHQIASDRLEIVRFLLFLAL